MYITYLQKPNGQNRPNNCIIRVDNIISLWSYNNLIAEIEELENHYRLSKIHNPAFWTKTTEKHYLQFISENIDTKKDVMIVK